MTTQMTSGGEMAGVELVCRLMAATPPYLYNPNGPPHCFFFSDLLRGLVAKRCATSPPADDPVSSKRIRIASIGSAFSAKSGGRDDARLGVDRQSVNPLSPSSFLPRLELLYRKLHEIEKETTSKETTNLPLNDGREEARRVDDRPTQVSTGAALESTNDSPLFPNVKHEAETNKIH